MPTIPPCYLFALSLAHKVLWDRQCPNQLGPCLQSVSQKSPWAAESGLGLATLQVLVTQTRGLS